MSEEVERLKDENEALRRKCSELETELGNVKALTPDKRDRILAALGVGKQSAQYKKVKVVLDQFINEVQGDG